MLNRLVLAIVIIIAVGIAYRIWIYVTLQRRIRSGLRLDAYQIGRPAILYFTTPDCIPCKTIQQPALDRIANIYGNRVQIIKVDATIQPKLADAWGVLSVPTTFIIDAKGRPRGVNHGPAGEKRLKSQLQAIGELGAEAESIDRKIGAQTIYSRDHDPSDSTS
ncbi:MAG: thioredoxin family protein [Chloroflexi bacterium]|nr:thioredoxin family protein [Chloroflexota bacterium]